MKHLAGITLLQLAAIALAILPTSSAAARPVALTGCPDPQCFVATPEAMVGAGDDLVWSANEVAATPPWPGPALHAGELWQIKKSGSYNSQRRLYREERATQVAFGNVVVVTVGATPYVYFVANYDGYITYIKRVPLAGGAATIVSRTSFIGLRDLKSDGSYLYWADVDGVRRMALAGGTITTLLRTNSAAQLDLDDNYLYFNAGSNGASLHRVLKAGGAVSLQVSTDSRVTDLVLGVGAGQSTVYWAEENASVRSRVIGSATTQTHQQATTNHTTSTIAFDGSRLFWIDCRTDYAGECAVRQRQAGTTLTLYGSDLSESLAAGKNLVSDAGQLFWTGDSFLWKYVHTAPPTVVFEPAFITAQQQGSGIVSATARVVVRGGDALQFSYGWSSENPAIRAPYFTQGPSARISATLAACDSQEGDLKVTVTDDIGRVATAVARVQLSSSRTPGGVCD